MRRLPIAILLLTSCVIGALAAQPSLKAGELIRVTLRLPSGQASGYFVSSDQETVTLQQLSDKRHVSWRRVEVADVERYRERRHVLLGAGIGLVAGTAIGIGIGSGGDIGDTPAEGRRALGPVGGLLGLTIGAVIGDVVRSHHWEPVLVWAPRAENLGISLRFRFR